MKIKIKINLDDTELIQVVEAITNLLQRVLQVASDTVMPVVDEIDNDGLQVADEQHECLEKVEIEWVEDYDCNYQVVNCTICGEDVSQEYEEAHGPDGNDDYDAYKEFKDEMGDGF